MKNYLNLHFHPEHKKSIFLLCNSHYKHEFFFLKKSVVSLFAAKENNLILFAFSSMSTSCQQVMINVSWFEFPYSLVHASMMPKKLSLSFCCRGRGDWFAVVFFCFFFYSYPWTFFLEYSSVAGMRDSINERVDTWYNFSANCRYHCCKWC